MTEIEMSRELQTKKSHSNSLDTLKTHEDKNCVVCGGVKFESIGTVKEHEYDNTTDESFPVVQCSHCKLVFLARRPDVTELDRIYPKNYYSYNLSMNAPDKVTGNRSFVQSIFYYQQRAGFKAKLGPVLKNLPKDRKIKILDVGCGVGSQLDSLREVFKNCETYGVEINELAVNKARSRGHQVFFGRFEDVEIPLKEFDVVVSAHVIEHVDRPDLFLAKCRDVVRQGGYILIETPNTDCVDFKLFKRKHWGGYHTPRHWYLFQARTFYVLAERLKIGIEKIQPYHSSVFWNWTFHSISLSIFGRRAADQMFPPVKIFYGGFRSFFLLGVFSVFERIVQMISGKASALWILFKVEK